MPSVKDLKKRIGIIKNIQQTTRAMKMVSASKLRRAQEAILHQRPYAKKILELIHRISLQVSVNTDYPLLRRLLPPGQMPSLVLVIITSDRGLCGSFNQNVIKACQHWIKTHADTARKIEICFLGKKGYDFFKTKWTPCGPHYIDLGGKVTFLKAKMLSDGLVARYLSGEVDEIKIIYNEFKNAMSQKVNIEDFLPLEPSQSSLTPAITTDVSLKTTADYLIKPSLEGVLHELLAKNFSIQVFRMLLESQAGEHGARMSAMENSTKNAGEMIHRLTLQFNKQRQAGITKELLEIISGSESQKNC